MHKIEIGRQTSGQRSDDTACKKCRLQRRNAGYQSLKGGTACKEESAGSVVKIPAAFLQMTEKAFCGNVQSGMPKGRLSVKVLAIFRNPSCFWPFRPIW